MSPTTLYREGTDLDDLLAELDTRYPGQVRVVEVTHPREGGVLGFFAKQRVGVHYRIVESTETHGAATGFGGARGHDAVRDVCSEYDAAAATAVRYDAASRYDAAPGIAIPARSGVSRDGFGPDPAAIRAALARRAPAPAAASPAAGSPSAGRVPASPAAGEDAGPSAAALDGAAAPGMAFAQILADIALKKAAGAASTGAARPAARQAVSRTIAEPAADTHSAAGDAAPTGLPRTSAAVSAAAETFAAMDFAALTPVRVATASAQTRAASSAAMATPSATTVAAPSAPAAPTIILRRRAVPTVSEEPAPSVDSSAPSASAPSTSTPSTSTPFEPAPDVRLAFTSLPRVDATGATADLPKPIEAAGTAAPRPGTLNWPLAAGGDTLAATTGHGAIAVLERPGVSETTAALEGMSMRGATRPVVDEHPTTGQSTPLTLRRQLLEVGVPVDRVPTDAVHVYAAIEDLVNGLAPAPGLPGAGRILVIAGPARDAVAAADSLVASIPGLFETTWTYRCPAALGTRRVSTTANALTTVTQASEIAAAARESVDGPTLVVIATDRVTTASSDTARDVLDALDADAVWAAVDATRKPTDTRRALRGLPTPDAIAVTNAERSSSPATVWELGLPIALVDGRPSTGPTWAVLLLGKLSELEESGCSAVPC